MTMGMMVFLRNTKLHSIVYSKKQKYVLIEFIKEEIATPPVGVRNDGI
ncbi:MAG: hypothetical protein H7844_14220 [Nitrospirae bacterium YQR-1]